MELEALNRRWVRLLRATERLASAETYEAIVDIVRTDLRDVVAADGVTFVQRDGDECHYVVENAVSPLWAGRRFPSSICISGWCMQHGRSAIIPNIYEDSRIPIDAYRPTFVASLVVVPVGLPAMATIGAYWANPFNPPRETVLQIEEFARAVAAAIRRVEMPEPQAEVTLATLLREADAVQHLDVVPTILDVVCQITGMGFAAVARVTEERWIACAVRDTIAFGLKPGGELDVKTTICNEIRQSRVAVVIDDVYADKNFRDHPTPAQYGFRSYISVPIIDNDGAFFGTLCAIDPRPAAVSRPYVVAAFTLFARLIGLYLRAQDKIAEGERTIQTHAQNELLRERFIAVLGHDLRNPLAALQAGINLLDRRGDAATRAVTASMRKPADRMAALIDDILDFARGRLAGGITLTNDTLVTDDGTALRSVLKDIVDEARAAAPGRAIVSDVAIDQPVRCDANRIGQLSANLLANAVTHGASDAPVVLTARSKHGGFTLEVTNSGPPIPQERRETLFEPFAGATSGQSRNGLGLGLYICAEIAKAHGGTLTFVSDAKATRFTFWMPPVSQAGAFRSSGGIREVATAQSEDR